MIQASQAQNGVRIGELSPAINQCRNAIDQFFNELEGLYAKKESLEKRFNQQLNELEE
jgi:hypothetical protein